MAEVIIDGTGSGFKAGVTSGNRLMVDISGAIINIGSVSANVDSIYVQSGVIFVDEEAPTSSNKNNPLNQLSYIISGTATGATGSEIGSITQFIGAGSYVKVLSYAGGNLVTIGSWS